MCEINKDEMKHSRVKTLKLDTESRNECKRRREEKKKAIRKAITKQAPSAQGEARARRVMGLRSFTGVEPNFLL